MIIFYFDTINKIKCFSIFWQLTLDKKSQIVFSIKRNADRIVYSEFLTIFAHWKLSRRIKEECYRKWIKVENRHANFRVIFHPRAMTQNWAYLGHLRKRFTSSLAYFIKETSPMMTTKLFWHPNKSILHAFCLNWRVHSVVNWWF